MAEITIPGMFLTGDHSSRPAANAVGAGALYSCSDHDLIYQSDGSSWTTWATLGSSGTGLSNLFVGTPIHPQCTEDSVGPNTNNGAWYIRSRVDADITVDTAVLNILTSTGNIDIGIFEDNAGTPGTLLGSTGSTASPGTGERSIALAAPVALTGGVIYYIGLAVSLAGFRCTGEAGAASHPFGGGWHLHGTLGSGAFPLASNPAAITWEGSARGMPAILFTA